MIRFLSTAMLSRLISLVALAADKVDMKSLMDATTKAGYPSAPKN